MLPMLPTLAQVSWQASGPAPLPHRPQLQAQQAQHYVHGGAPAVHFHPSEPFMLSPMPPPQQYIPSPPPHLHVLHSFPQPQPQPQHMWLPSGGNLAFMGGPPVLLHGPRIAHSPLPPLSSNAGFAPTFVVAQSERGFLAAAGSVPPQFAASARPMTPSAVASRPFFPHPSSAQLAPSQSALSALQPEAKQSDSGRSTSAAHHALSVDRPVRADAGGSSSILRKQSAAVGHCPSSSLRSGNAQSPSPPSSSNSPPTTTPALNASDALSSSNGSQSSLAGAARHSDVHNGSSASGTSSSAHAGAPQSNERVSSSRLLTHISKTPSFVLPFTVHRSRLPGHVFNGLASSSPTSLVEPGSWVTQARAADTVTVNVRVMGGPPPSELYFVAADLAQLIHSRKSNIAKAVAEFTDSERARCAVTCVRSNHKQSTHVLTVLSLQGVRRLLQNSRAPIAMSILDRIHEQVNALLGHPQQQHNGVKPGKRKVDDLQASVSDVQQCERASSMSRDADADGRRSKKIKVWR